VLRLPVLDFDIELLSADRKKEVHKAHVAQLRASVFVTLPLSLSLSLSLVMCV